jgi:ActR/RegA family two-component response regulator
VTNRYRGGSVFKGSNLATIRHSKTSLMYFLSIRDKERVTGFRYPNTLPEGYPAPCRYLKLRVVRQYAEAQRDGKGMIQCQVANLAYQLAKIGDGKEDSFAFTFPLRTRTRPRLAKLNSPNGLVVTSDEGVSQKLAGIMNQCGFATFLAFTVWESRRILDHHQVCLVLCDERLIDGKYEHILSATRRLRTRTPVIVVSPAGDWPDYLKAICAGAFDYVAYPPVPGDLPRAIRHALASRAGGLQETRSKFANSSTGGSL